LGNVTTTDIVAIDNSSTVTSINNNTKTLRDEFDKVVYKDGREELTGNLDANNKRIINLPDAITDTEPMTLRQLAAITEVVDGGLAAEVLLRIAGDAARPTFTALLLSSGSSLVGFTHSGTGAVLRTLEAKLRETARSVTDYGAVGDGTTDDYLNIQKAIDAAGDGGVIVFPFATYKVSEAINMRNGQTWIMEGCTLKNTTDTKHVIRVNAKDNWSILGKSTLQGTLVTAATAAESGLYITDGSGYLVEGVVAEKFKGKGIYLDGNLAPAYRSKRGQFTNCSANENTIALQIDAGNEYNTFSNFNAGGNALGTKIYGGNNTFVGGNIVDNTTGVYLGNGTNHGHGVFLGVNINHNTSANIEAVGVLNGYTFIGCHIYGNGTNHGLIWLNGCKGITIQGGIIDCWIYNDSGTGSGANYIIDNYFPGDYGVSLLSNNSALGQLYISGNYNSAGLSPLNDPAPIYVEATRASSTQSVAAGATTLIFNNEIKDKRDNYDNTTGVFTAPVDGTYQIETLLTIAAASGLVNSYVAVVHNNTTDYGYIPIVALSGTLGIGVGAITVTLAANDTLRLKSTITGTTPVLATTQSRIAIQMVSR
jgi:hypothetical protein